MAFANEIVAIETPVTDYLYEEIRSDRILRDSFLNYLKPDRPPRKGENILVDLEQWQEKLLAFAQLKELLLCANSRDGQVTEIRDRIFGAPRAIEAGGALANSFDVMVKSRIGGEALTGGVFITAIGEGISGEVFANSLKGKLIAPPAQGQQTEAHIIPVDGDRIIITVPSFTNPPSQSMSVRQIDDVAIDHNTKMVMLGGYMLYTGKYNDFLDAILNKIVAVDSEARKRPVLVLTAAAHDIAASPALKNALNHASQVTRLVVCANAGEFRRLMEMDSEWRKRHEFKWKNLEGQALEKAKQADDAYRADKLAANQAAYLTASQRYSKDKTLPVSFIVTNGKQGVCVVDGNGVSKNYAVPKPPHGVTNTVGAGDGFAGGYLLGHVRGLRQKNCVALGFVNAGEIVGQDEARLKPRHNMALMKNEVVQLDGLPAYLNPQNADHARLLAGLTQGPERNGMEIEKRFLVVADAWKASVQETFDIQQNYIPSIVEGGIQLRMSDVRGQVKIVVSHSEHGTLCTLPVPQNVIKKFGRDNLRAIREEDGLIPVGATLEVRIRLQNGKQWMTIKADTTVASERYELPFPISRRHFRKLLPHCPEGIIKARHIVDGGWEIDVYKGPNEGLVKAEIELCASHQTFAKPEWLGEDVTADRRYSNRALARMPYSFWNIA